MLEGICKVHWRGSAVFVCKGGSAGVLQGAHWREFVLCSVLEGICKVHWRELQCVGGGLQGALKGLNTVWDTNNYYEGVAPDKPHP